MQRRLEEQEKDYVEKYLSKKFKEVNMIYTKRRVFDRSREMPLNVCDFVRPSKTLIQRNTSLEKIWQEKIKYVRDNYKVNGLLDFWQLPEETKVLGKGDCDDSGSYRLATAKSNGLGDNLFACLGFVGNSGHFFIVAVDKILLKNLEKFEDSVTIIENTSNNYYPQHYKFSNYKICYIFNENKAWEVDGSVSFGKKVAKEFGVKKNG
jgi:hypothetical protein